MRPKNVSFVLLDEVDWRILTEVARNVARTVGVGVTLRSNLQCEAGFDRARKQWRADAMLEGCVVSYAPSNGYAVGLTTKDLYAPSLNFVFGLAERESGAAIVSLSRLTEANEEAVVARIAKEIVHEVGHLEGLAHCSNDRCVMWFSNSLPETDRKSMEFCSECEGRRSP